MLKRVFSSLPLLFALSALVVGACECEPELALLPGDINGQICSPTTGQPIAGLAVFVEGAAGTDETLTDLFGKWEVLDIASGPVSVRATVEEEERVWDDLQVEAGQRLEIEDPECRPPEPPPPPPRGNVAGCVCEEESGTWITGANVFITDDEGNVVVTGTDENGCFLLEDAPVGDFTLRVERGTFSREFEVSITADETFQVPSPDVCEEPVIIDPPGAGSINGRVCAPDGTTWLAEASVYIVLEDGTRIEVLTDGDGRYLLDGVPPGDHTLTIEKGSFVTERAVTVESERVLEIPEEECAIEANLAVAVVSGQYDDVRSVLVNVGFDAANITDFTGFGGNSSGWMGDLLGDVTTLDQYDVLFFNCGVDELNFRDEPGYQDNLRAFVEGGGSIYASDQAYDIVEATFPDLIDFYGDDSRSNTAENGDATESIIGTVSDIGLAQSLGQQTVDLHYPLAFWVPMESVAANGRVFIRGDAPIFSFLGNGPTLRGVPHTVGFAVGEGRVLYTSFHQEPGINQTMERVLQLLVFEL